MTPAQLLACADHSGGTRVLPWLMSVFRGGLIQVWGHRRRYGGFAHEAFRVGLVCLRQDILTGGLDGVGLAVMHLVRGHQADADVMVILVVPGEEAAAEGPGILDTAEAPGELGLIFQGSSLLSVGRNLLMQAA